MNKPAKPYSLRRTIVVGLLVATCFALLSMFFLYMQASNSFHRLAGEVVQVQSDSLLVQNVHGDVTKLMLSPDAKMRDIATLDELSVGQHVMTRGIFEQNGSFTADRLRVIRGPERQ